jgi:hypothetical protein
VNTSAGGDPCATSVATRRREACWSASRWRSSARLGVGNSGGDQLGEGGEAILDVVGQRLTRCGAGRHHAPDLGVDDNRGAGARADPGLPDGVGDHAGDVGEVVNPRRAAGLEDELGDRRAVEGPPGASLEGMRALAPGADHGRRPVGLIAGHLDQRKVEHVGDLPRHGGEYLGRRRATGDERRDAPQRVLLGREDRVVLAQHSFGPQPVLDVDEGDDGAATVGQVDRRRDVGDREHRSVTAEEPIEVALDGLPRRPWQQHRAIGRGVESPVGVLVVDGLVAGAAEKLVGAVVAER